MKVKKHIAELLKQLIETDDSMARMEIIDNSEVLNDEMSNESSNEELSKAMEERDNAIAERDEIAEKFKTRFIEELTIGNVNNKDLNDEIDDVEVDDEDGKDFSEMTFEEAGITT